MFLASVGFIPFKYHIHVQECIYQPVEKLAVKWKNICINVEWDDVPKIMKGRLSYCFGVLDFSTYDLNQEKIIGYVANGSLKSFVLHCNKMGPVTARNLSKKFQECTKV